MVWVQTQHAAPLEVRNELRHALRRATLGHGRRQLAWNSRLWVGRQHLVATAGRWALHAIFPRAMLEQGNITYPMQQYRPRTLPQNRLLPSMGRHEKLPSALCLQPVGSSSRPWMHLEDCRQPEQP